MQLTKLVNRRGVLEHEHSDAVCAVAIDAPVILSGRGNAAGLESVMANLPLSTLPPGANAYTASAGVGMQDEGGMVYVYSVQFYRMINQ